MVNFGAKTAERTVGEFGAAQQNSTGFASWPRYCTVLQQWASAKLCGVEQRAPPIFGRAAIALGIGPHFLFVMFLMIGSNGVRGNQPYRKKRATWSFVKKLLM